MAGKRPRGRPSSYSQTVADEICERLGNGEPLKVICRDAHMPGFVTVWRWEQSNEEFRNLSARAREIGTHNMADDCIAIADNPDLDPQDKRIRIDTRLRLIGKWNAKRYGDKTALTGDDGGPINHTFRWAKDDEEAVCDPSR
jgi:hypothetical protein